MKTQKGQIEIFQNFTDDLFVAANGDINSELVNFQKFIIRGLEFDKDSYTYVR